MISFQEQFTKNMGKPFIHNGKEIMMIDYFELPYKKCRMKINRVSTKSKWKQGVELQVKGSIKINNQVVKKGTRLWEHTAPKEVTFEVESKDKKIIVTNIWDFGDGVTQKWHNGGAMYFEEIENGKRYYCNDGQPNDDFTDLIFELVIIE